MDQFIYSPKEKLSSDLCAGLRRAFKTDQYIPHITKGPENEYTRNTGKYFYDCLLLRASPSMPFFEHLKGSIGEYLSAHKILQTCTIKIDEICHLQRYSPGEFYSAEHCEHNASHPKRCIAWMYYLSNIDPKEGGGTRFPYQNIDLIAEEGKLYMWPSGFTHTHHGIPSENKFKYILTGWCSYQEKPKSWNIGKNLLKNQIYLTPKSPLDKAISQSAQPKLINKSADNISNYNGTSKPLTRLDRFIR